MAWRDRLTDLRETVEDRVGVSVVPTERLAHLEESRVELGATRRELDALAWTALDYGAGRPQEMKAVERRKLAQQARVVWKKDPQAGAVVDLMNEFTFSRGLPNAKAADPMVQEALDEAWADPDNELVLTSYPAQLALGTDLSLQCNLFILVFDDGDDGKVKLGLLDHDTVEDVVTDPDNRLRVLYYVAKEYRREWDFKNDGPKVDYQRDQQGRTKVKYYEHWRNVEALRKQHEESGDTLPELAPKEKLGKGRVYHIAINRTSEMVFGHPTFDRLIRWFNAYNRLMDARLDIIAAKAAFVYKRTVKGTDNQLHKMALQAVSRRSALGASSIEGLVPGPSGAAGIANMNKEVDFESMDMDTGASAALQDGQMIRAQTSAGTQLPPTYFGDLSSANLATATSLELPVLKTVENRQEVVEALVRFFNDRVIERAVEAGRIPEKLKAGELQEAHERETMRLLFASYGGEKRAMVALRPKRDERPEKYIERVGTLLEAYEDQVDDEALTHRDLSYEFSMPSPLRREMAALVTAVSGVATTFDPNNSNMELARTLLTIVLGEAFELEDPAKAVDKIFPEGYVDPAVAAAQMQADAAQAQDPNAQGPFGEFTPGQTGALGADGRNHPPSNAYGAPMQSRRPEQVAQEGRDQEIVALLEEVASTLPEAARSRLAGRLRVVGDEFDSVAAGILPPESNGTGG